PYFPYPTLFRSFLAVQDVALAIGAEAENGVDPALDLAVDLGPQLGHVDGLVIVHRGNDRGDDAFDFDCLHGRFSFIFSCLYLPVTQRVTSLPGTACGRRPA